MFSVLRIAGVPYLLSTSLVGRLPAAMSSLALVRLVVDQGGSFLFASILTAAYVLAGTFGQPVLARIIDRTGRRRLVLLSAAVVSTAGFVLTALLADSAPVAGVAAVVVAGFATPPIEPALRSLWADLVEPGPRLTSAFALDAAVQEVGFVLGPLLTALGIIAFGAQGNVLLMGAIGISGTLLFAAHSRLRNAPIHADAPPHAGTPLSSPGFRRLLITVVGAAIPVGAFTITATAFAEFVGAPDLSALALALNAAGALSGALLFGRFPPRAEPASLIRPIAGALGAVYLLSAIVALPVAAWMVAIYLAGLLLPPFLTQVFAQTPRSVLAMHRTEANAWVISSFAIGIAGGTLVAGVLVEAFPPGTGISVAVVVASALAVAAGAQGSRRALGRTTR